MNELKMNELKMNELKIAFIICANDQNKLDSCLNHIHALEIPKGFQTEVIVKKEATSMTAGYQEAMSRSDAKYKIYLHQDVLIVYKKMLSEMLDIFRSSSEIGVLGVVGYKRLAQTGAMWDSPPDGRGELYENGFDHQLFRKVTEAYEEVAVVDGLLIATQHDVPWRTDFLSGWHFYDVSCCIEHALAGYKAAVPKQEEIWCMHNCGKASTDKYGDFCLLIKKEYNQKWLDQIGIHMETEEYDKASELIDFYQRIWKENDEFSILASELAIRQSDLSRAMSIIEQGLIYNTSNYELIFMMGNVFEQQKNTILAGLCYQHAQFICEVPEDKEYLYNYYQNFQMRYPETIPRMSVLLKASDNLPWLIMCKKILADTVPDESYEIIWILVNPTESVEEYVKNQQGTVVQCPGKRESEAYNLGIEAAEKGRDPIVIYENAYPLKHGIFNMQMELYRNQTTGGVCASSREPHKEKGIGNGALAKAMRYANYANAAGSVYSESLICLEGPIVMFRSWAIRQYGWFDPRFSLFKYQLADLGFRLIQNGMELKMCHNSFVFWGKPEENYFTDEKENCLFEEKWAINLSYSCFQRNELIQMMNAEPNSEIRVLEIGCACGALLLAVRYKYPQAILYGVELDEGPYSIVKNFANVTNENIENSVLNYPLEFFDYIICADVLEHLREPQKLLARLYPHIKPGGHILTSIPNVMNISVLKDLIHGYWTYSDAGILDRTHVRFFTYNEIVAMFEAERLHIKQVLWSAERISEEEGKLIDQLCSISNLPRDFYEAYQYLLDVQK